MSVANGGTSVPFAEVDRYAWAGAGTIPFVRGRRYQRNITTSLGMRGTDLSRSGTDVLAVPLPALRPLRAHITAATESGEQRFAHDITDDQAAEALGLHIGRFLFGEKRVRHESVIGEHRVVASRHPLMIERGSKA